MSKSGSGNSEAAVKPARLSAGRVEIPSWLWFVPRIVRWHAQPAPYLGVPILAVVLMLAACGAAPAKNSTLSVTIEEQALTAQVRELPGATSLSSDGAIVDAHRYVPNWQAAKSVSARHVALTLRDSAGTVAFGLDSRPVWLVTFGGVAYAPASSPTSGCACSQYGNQPDTAVALDAANGALVTTYGLDGSSSAS